jgi:hypothetical protein
MDRPTWKREGVHLGAVEHGEAVGEPGAVTVFGKTAADGFDPRLQGGSS